MTQLLGETYAGAKARRRQGRFLALIWGCWWTFFLMALSFPFLRLGCGAWPSQFATGQIVEVVWLALLVSMPWITFALAWRHETFGGLVLCTEGLLLLVVTVTTISQTAESLPLGRDVVALPCVAAIGASLALPPLAAGLLLLSARLRSRGEAADSTDV
jgi:hypothetical protein